jgi:4-carboxymuconolactone decarboxylase
MMSTTVHGLNAVIRRQQPMDDAQADRAAFDTAERLLGAPLVLPLGAGEPPSGADFRRLATRHTFGDSWTRTGLDLRSRALVSVTIAATLGTREPLRGQLRIALNNEVTKDEIVDLFIHLEAYAGAARAFDSYQIALEVFAETPGTELDARSPSRRQPAALPSRPLPGRRRRARGQGGSAEGGDRSTGVGQPSLRMVLAYRGQAGACRRVVSIPGASGHGVTE